MKRYEKCKFAVFFDKPNPHVIIHEIGMCPLEMHGGESVDDEQSGWGYFVNEREAQLFADGICKSKDIPEPTNCGHCVKNSNSIWYSENYI